MKEQKRRQSLSGAVLIMVMTVMIVLIIMLMATLTVVTTANRRIYTKFEENQAYYTARSALDVYMNNLFGDGTNKAVNSGGSVRQFQYTDDTGNPAHTDMFQGTALQLDLYKIRSQGETAFRSFGDAEALGVAENAVIGDGTYLASSPEENNYALKDNGSDPDGLPYIEYDVTFPQVADASNSYGKMVDIDTFDKDGDGETTDQVARIRVEILDRFYDTGGAYTMQDIADVMSHGGSYNGITTANIQDAIRNGKRSKDQIRIKVTSTVQLMDTDGVAVVILGVSEVKTPDTSNAINSLGSMTGSGAGLVAAGGASTLNTGSTVIDASGTAGTIFALGSLEWNSTGTSVFDEGASVVAKGYVDPVTGEKKGITFTNAQNISAAGDDVFMYTEGIFDITSSFSYGTAAHPMSIICDEFRYNQTINITGNIYSNKFNLGGNNGAQQINGGANIYTKDLYVSTSGNGCQVDTENKTITINSAGSTDVHYYGDLYIDGAKVGTDPPYDDTYTITNTNVKQETGTFDLFNSTAVTDESGKIKQCIKLPAKLPSQNTDTIYLHTVQSRYGDYFEEGSFDENGDLISNTPGLDSYDTANIQSLLLTAEKSYYSSNNMAVPATPTLNLFTDAAPKDGSVVTGSGILSASAVSGNIQVDTSGGAVTLQLNPNEQYSGKIEVIGGGALNIVMPEGAAGSTQNYNFNNFELYDENVTNVSGQTIDNGVTVATKINIFVGQNSNVNISNNAFFAGYFYMPLSVMTNSSANNGISKEYKYNGTTTTKNYFIVGSITCGNYDTGGANSGVCFLDPDSGSSVPGAPFLNANPTQFTRS